MSLLTVGEDGFSVGQTLGEDDSHDDVLES